MSPPKNHFEGVRSHSPTKLVCLSSPKTMCAREIPSLTGYNYSLEVAQSARDFFGARKATPAVR